MHVAVLFGIENCGSKVVVLVAFVILQQDA